MSQFPLINILAQFQSFIPGQRLIDGGELLAMANQLFSYDSTAQTANTGGLQLGAPTLKATINAVTRTSKNSGDTALLPLALPGATIVVMNPTDSTFQLMAQPTNPVTGVGDRITSSTAASPSTTTTTFAVTTGQVMLFICFDNGFWKQFISA